MASDLFPDVRVLQDTSTNVAGNTGIGWRVNMAQAMVQAAENGLRTATLSTTSAPAADILNSMNMLSLLGYNASISGSTMTVSW